MSVGARFRNDHAVHTNLTRTEDCLSFDTLHTASVGALNRLIRRTQAITLNTKLIARARNRCATLATSFIFTNLTWQTARNANIIFASTAIRTVLGVYTETFGDNLIITRSTDSAALYYERQTVRTSYGIVNLNFYVIVVETNDRNPLGDSYRDIRIFTDRLRIYNLVEVNNKILNHTTISILN